MKVKELIEELMKLPQESEVFHVSNDGCSECNGEGLPWYHPINDVSFLETGAYPFHKAKDVVTIS